MTIRVVLSSKNIWIPPVCACCGGGERGESIQVTLDKHLPAVIHCASCTRHFAEQGRFYSTFAGILLLAGVILLCFIWPAGLALIFCAVVTELQSTDKEQPRIKAMRSPGCIAMFPSEGARLLRRGGEHYTFEFDQEDFGLAFVDVNRELLVDADPELLARVASRALEPSER